MPYQPVASHFIDGEYVEDTKGAIIECVYQTTGEIIARLHSATPEIVEKAIAAASAAQAMWKKPCQQKEGAFCDAQKL